MRTTIAAYACEYPVLHIPSQRTTYADAIVSVEEYNEGPWKYRVILTYELDGKTHRCDEGGVNEKDRAMDKFLSMVTFATGAFV